MSETVFLIPKGFDLSRLRSVNLVGEIRPMHGLRVIETDIASEPKIFSLPSPPVPLFALPEYELPPLRQRIYTDFGFSVIRPPMPVCGVDFGGLYDVHDPLRDLIARKRRARMRRKAMKIANAISRGDYPSAKAMRWLANRMESCGRADLGKFIRGIVSKGGLFA